MAASVQKSSGALLRRLRKGRFFAIFGLALVLWLASGTRFFLELPTLRDVEARAHDAHFQLRNTGIAFSDVVIVGIQSSSLDQNGLRNLRNPPETVKRMSENIWPWPRGIHAQVIDQLFRDGAKIVAVDIAFPSERDGDWELVEVLKKYRGRVVLASLKQVQIGTAELRFIPPHPSFIEASGADSAGLVLFAPDKGDAVVRRYDSHTSELREAGLDENGSDLVHFAVRAAEKFTGQNIVPRYNEILPYQGPPATFEYIPVEEILMDAEFKSRSAHFKERDVFRDKLVFYGPIAEIMHDVHATPLGTMPGVEIHAQLASSLIKRTRIRDAAVGWERLVSLAIVILCGLILLKLRNPVLQVVAVVATLGLSFGFTHLMFLRETYFPTVPWLFSGGFTALAGIVYLFVLERLERAQVRKVFGRFVSKRIAEVVLKNAEEFEHARAGERRAVAVLFSDIRSFTTWSERAAPENLVGQLNEYFESMVPLIEDTDGNAQKFIGDAILAAWGDTHSSGHAEDSRRAVTAALKMRQVLCDLNTRWAGRDDRITIQIGIGINHGTVVTGEVGHSERREFTVLGDGVNFAARLESATKQFHTDCLVGESVEELTRDQFVFREVGFLRVKGKTKPVHIFTPISEKTTPAPEWLADYHRALALHRTRDFENAAALFTDVKSRNGGDDFLCDWYLDLGRRYLRESPREDWDGSETLTEK